jgi:TolB-like protein
VIAVVIVAAWLLSTVLGGPAYDRLAVLPPVNLMNDHEQEYFVGGVHDALISELQRAGIAVIARTSVLQYENTQKPIREIAGELGVDALIESSVFRAADSVVLEIRLVDGTTEEYLADPIARSGELRDVVSLYRELTSAIATEVQAALTPEAVAVLASARPVNPQVYEAYLKGQSHFQRGTPTALDQAFEYFQQALLLDSTYAPAQARIALVWAARGAMWFIPPREAAAHASVAIRRALALDSTLAEVQYVVALVRQIEWDWEGADAAFRKAIEINPNFAGARAAYAYLLSTMERPVEARAQMDRALALDLYNPMLRGMNAHILCDDRRYAECIEEYEAAVRIEPDYPVAQMSLAWAYHDNGDYDQALAQVRRWWFPGDQELDEALDQGYAEGGFRAAMLRYAETLAARPEAAERLCIRVATTFAWAGDIERTLEWFELAYQAHDPNLPSNLLLTVQPMLHDDPRYHDLRRRVGLPE